MKNRDLIQELRSISMEELGRRLERIRIELAKLYLKKSVKRLENVALLRQHRKEIARINTIIVEKRNSSSESA